ncbi:MAG TPA: hypothetical protein VJS92_12940 [Candidatus Polarisedimenticolaceae bacterium]|nr:hypothetical protein [Candidatus Polarisedimenticolaceae bacterium]
MGLLTTSPGSLPLPVELRAARWRHSEGELDAAGLRAAEELATRAAIAAQESLGLDLLVDGQLDRSDMVSFFADRVEGTEPAGLVRCFDNFYVRKPRIADALVRREPITLERWRFAQSLTARPVKAVLTGPFTLAAWSFDEHYASRREACLAWAEILGEEAAELAAAGAREIQLDEPAIAAYPAELPFAVAGLERVTAGLAGRARTWVHLCYDIPPAIVPGLARLPVDGLLLELAHSGFRLLDALAGWPQDKLLAAGIVDVLDPAVESAAELVARARRLLALVPRERLWLTPDAGLRALQAEPARQKLAALVAAASEL